MLKMLTNRIKTEELSQCRVCLGEAAEGMIDIFVENIEIMPQESRSLWEIFEEATGISASDDDGLTRLLCHPCLVRLREAILFRRQAEASYEKLVNMHVNTNPKIDLTDSSEQQPVIKAEKPDSYTENSEYEEPLPMTSNLNNFAPEWSQNSEENQKNNTADLWWRESYQSCSQDDLLAVSGTQPEQSNGKSNQIDLPAKCNECGEAFMSMEHRQCHMRMHLRARKRYICPVCSKGFVSTTTCRYHIRRHSKEFPFLCYTCIRTFNSESEYNEHTLTHGKERPYACPICYKSFKRRYHCTEHIRVHEKDKRKEKPFCNECNIPFLTTTALIAHSHIHILNSMTE